MELKSLIKQILELRASMWPNSHDQLNIVDFDHIIATLVEETGELRQAVRSFMGRPYSPEKTALQEDILEELGDMLTPFVALCEMCGVEPEQAAQAAIAKLSHRKERKNALLDAGKKVLENNQ